MGDSNSTQLSSKKWWVLFIWILLSILRRIIIIKWPPEWIRLYKSLNFGLIWIFNFYPYFLSSDNSSNNPASFGRSKYTSRLYLSFIKLWVFTHLIDKGIIVPPFNFHKSLIIRLTSSLSMYYIMKELHSDYKIVIFRFEIKHINFSQFYDLRLHFI